MDDTSTPALTAAHNKHDRIWLVHPDHHDVEWTAEDPALDDDPDMSGTNQLYVRGDLYDALAAKLAAETTARMTAERERDAARTQRDVALDFVEPLRKSGQLAGMVSTPLPDDADEADEIARRFCNGICGLFAGTDADYRRGIEWRLAGYIRRLVRDREAALARASGAEALARQMAGVIEETWLFASMHVLKHAADCGGQMHEKHAGMLARIHAAVTAAHAAGHLPSVTTSRLPIILSEHGYDIAALSPPPQADAGNKGKPS